MRRAKRGYNYRKMQYILAKKVKRGGKLAKVTGQVKDVHRKKTTIPTMIGGHR